MDRRRVLGTVVFSGMLAATVIGVIAIPMLYFIFPQLSELRRKSETAHSARQAPMAD